MPAAVWVTAVKLWPSSLHRLNAGSVFWNRTAMWSTQPGWSCLMNFSGSPRSNAQGRPLRRSWPMILGWLSICPPGTCVFWVILIWPRPSVCKRCWLVVLPTVRLSRMFTKLAEWLWILLQTKGFLGLHCSLFVNWAVFWRPGTWITPLHWPSSNSWTSGQLWVTISIARKSLDQARILCPRDILRSFVGRNGVPLVKMPCEQLMVVGNGCCTTVRTNCFSMALASRPRVLKFEFDHDMWAMLKFVVWIELKSCFSKVTRLGRTPRLVFTTAWPLKGKSFSTQKKATQCMS